VSDDLQTSSNGASAPGARPVKKRVMGPLDVTLFTVSAILVVDQLTASASIGVSAVGWWVITIVLFLVPSGLITAELATAYPEQGGIYAWVRRAYGRRWAARTTYWYWVNVAMWMPSVYLLFTGVLVGLFWTDASVFQQSLVAIVMVWVTVLVGTQTLSIGKSVTNANALIKAAVILTIGIGGIVLTVRHGAANSFAVSEMLPDLGLAKVFLPVLVYQLLGFELVSSMSDELKNPRRDVLKGIFRAAGILSAFYVLGTVGILLAMPMDQIGLTEGLVDTFKAVFGNGSIWPWILGLGVVATYFGNMVTWSLGANRSAVEAAHDGELPDVLRSETKRGAPLWAFVISGVIATVVLLFAGIFIKTEDNLYFALFASSSAIFLLPYLLLFPAVIRLRRLEPDQPRPFRVPGGRVGVWAAVILATGSILASLVLFLWTPGVTVEWSYTGPLLGIVAAAIAVGEVVVRRSLNRASGSMSADGGSATPTGAAHEHAVPGVVP
jgi:amino acid transporter